jgi:hypothetical protein
MERLKAHIKPHYNTLAGMAGGRKYFSEFVWKK